MKSIATIIILFFTLVKITFCQVAESVKVKKLPSINLQYNITNFIPHDDTLVPLKKGLFQNIEVDAIVNSNGNKKWHRNYKFPQLGISLNYYDFGNNNVLGKGIGLYPFMVLKLANKNNFNLNFRYGAGLAYISEIYKPTNYPTNIAISTPINILIDFRVNVSYNINRYFILESSLIANHISNGAIKKPNYGLNSVGIGVGLTYNFRESKQINSSQTDFLIKKAYYIFSATGAVKEVGDAGGPKYYPLSFQTSYIKPLNSIVELGGNVDIIYDKSVRYHLQKKEMDYNSPIDDFSIGASAKLKLPLDKLSIFGDLGIYLYQPNPRFHLFYQQVGITYSIFKNIEILMALKTHFTIADHLNFGVSFKL